MTRHRAKRTARPGRIGHGSATGQMVNLCGKLFCAGLPRRKHGVVAPNLGDDSGRHKDHGTTERPFGCPEITERLSGKLFVGWVQPTNSPEKTVGFTHPSAPVIASNQQGESPCQSVLALCNRK